MNARPVSNRPWLVLSALPLLVSVHAGMLALAWQSLPLGVAALSLLFGTWLGLINGCLRCRYGPSVGARQPIGWVWFTLFWSMALVSESLHPSALMIWTVLPHLLALVLVIMAGRYAGRHPRLLLAAAFVCATWLAVACTLGGFFPLRVAVPAALDVALHLTALVLYCVAVLGFLSGVIHPAQAPSPGTRP